MGFEPISTVLETVILPLNYRDIMAGVAGLEPADVGVKVPCLNRLGYTPVFRKPKKSTAYRRSSGILVLAAIISCPSLQ